MEHGLKAGGKIKHRASSAQVPQVQVGLGLGELERSQPGPPLPQLL